MTLEPHLALEDCKWCRATGIHRYRCEGTTFPCRVCHGTGSVLVPQPPRPCVRCQNSPGSDPEAKLLHGADVHCIACFGSGWAHHQPHS